MRAVVTDPEWQQGFTSWSSMALKDSGKPGMQRTPSNAALRTPSASAAPRIIWGRAQAQGEAPPRCPGPRLPAVITTLSVVAAADLGEEGQVPGSPDDTWCAGIVCVSCRSARRIRRTIFRFRLLLEGLVPGCSAMPAAGFWRFVLPVRRLHSNTGLP